MSNEILKFADTATNILTQSEYAADAERNTGNVPGVARSKLVNKVLRQCAFISNGFAEYLISKVGGDVLDNNDSAALLAKITSAFTVIRTNENDVINGNFDLWQRNTTFSVTVTNTWTADRFVEQLVGSTSSVSRQATAGTENFNARFFKRTTVTSSLGATNCYRTLQTNEDVRKYSGKTVTYSFWAKADSTRNMAIEFVQNFGTGGSPSAEVNSIGVTTIALTTSWQKFTKTVTFPSISGKVLGTSNNSYTGLNFWFDAGSNFNTRTNSLGQQSGTFDIAQIKSEFGSEATEFTLNGGSLASDRVSCQRFWQKSYDAGAVPGTASSTSGGVFSSGTTAGGLYISSSAIFPVTMRSIPAVTIYAPLTGASGKVRTISNGGLVDGADVNVFTTSENETGLRVYAVPPSGHFYQFHYVANAELF
jgi:hypothetical protein